MQISDSGEITTVVVEVPDPGQHICTDIIVNGTNLEDITIVL